ncbi:MAG TPA: hypothetical protein VFA52_00010 [Candidatus Paceibacterota bacterium]|jgi:predicted subunit of tRNA(5-methylaminomethyl-2-thiouridylate) methyltransferase|nr:hypothetical protein [Candidatus Paceibacterota bacterium]
MNPSAISQQEVAVLFSGGRDSSLAACIYALKNYKVHLISFISGIGIKSEISEYRFKELKEMFPEHIMGRVFIPIFGLFRRIAILNIENDFAKYKYNLILVGEKMAMHAAAIVYCLKRNIVLIADGTSGYQEDMPEQMPEAINEFRELHRAYGIEYMTPIRRFHSDDEVKYTLMEIGISTKSLEGISIFAESFSKPSPDILRAYIREKLPLCREFINLMQGNIDDTSSDTLVTVTDPLH